LVIVMRLGGAIGDQPDLYVRASSGGWRLLPALPQLVQTAAPIDRTLYWRMRVEDQAAGRQGDWKYLRIGGKEHLFNVRKDPRERAELIGVYPDIAKDLKARWAAWNATMLPYPERSFSEATSAY